MAEVHPSLYCYDLGCYVTGQGAAFTLMRENEAIKKGLVKAISFKGEKGEFKGYVPAKWDTATKLPYYIATHGCKSGRVEPRSIDGGSNSAVAEHVTLLVAEKKPAKTEKKPVAKLANGKPASSIKVNRTYRK